MTIQNGKVDVVYSWVDDSWTGYKELLAEYGLGSNDLNPNRTRDNLETLKYSLRSLDKYAPWVGNIFILTMRPQVPEWLNLDDPRINIIHHDEFIPTEHLPTFNSLSIISNLHRLTAVSERFIYFEDDMMLGAPTTLRHFVTDAGKMKVYRRFDTTQDAAKWQNEGRSPWDLAMSYTNKLLNESFGIKIRNPVIRVPLFVEKSSWSEMWERWAEAFERTSASKFRSKETVASEHLYPYFQIATGKAIFTSFLETHMRSMCVNLENNQFGNFLGFLILRIINPVFIVLNDDFGPEPSPVIVARVRAYLESQYSTPSSYEKRNI